MVASFCSVIGVQGGFAATDTAEIKVCAVILKGCHGVFRFDGKNLNREECPLFSGALSIFEKDTDPCELHGSFLILKVLEWLYGRATVHGAEKDWET